MLPLEKTSGDAGFRYQEVLDWIASDIQAERRTTNRKMKNVFFWCFLMPLVLTALVMILTKYRVLPFTARAYADWSILIFPVLYSLYILGTEFLSGASTLYRRGGMAGTLAQAHQQAVWRERVCLQVQARFNLPKEGWNFVIHSLEIDLQNLSYRAKYLTALSGAVFFLIMEGIDTLAGDEGGRGIWVRNPVTGMPENISNDVTQFIGLALFLMLLFLSWNQAVHFVRRYLGCLELVRLKSK